MENNISSDGIVNYINEIRSFLRDPMIIQNNRISPTYFTRHRKILFNRTISLILSKTQHTLAARIDYAFEKLGEEALGSYPTPSAFTQARAKLDPSIFVGLLNHSNSIFYHNEHEEYEIIRYHYEVFGSETDHSAV